MENPNFLKQKYDLHNAPEVEAAARRTKKRTGEEFPLNSAEDANVRIQNYLNRFKEINDNFGHLTGDYVLRETAQRMGLVLRKPDLQVRYGGDEFCMIMHEATQEQAEVAISRLKLKVEGTLFEGLNGDGKIPVSISVGTVTYNDNFTNVEELMALADKNMYKNKNTSAPDKKSNKRRLVNEK